MRRWYDAAVFARLRTYFLTGLLVLSPVVLTGYIVWKLFVFVDHLLGTTMRGGYLRPGGIPGIGFLTVIALILLTGAVANTFLARSLGALVESLLLRVPFLRGLYLILKEMGEALLGDRRQAFQRVVLIPYPSADLYSIGFVTTPPPASMVEALGEPVEGVFIPTPPNPATGQLVYYPKRKLIPTNLKIDQAIKIVVSCGVVVPSDPAMRA